ncbi:GTP pyrophosphokinase family protein [Aeribacillus pallidus]|jgi:putative GTP pyrophosphokinase|uniref:GTP pyrophosphokinase n=1 Tax=Aeribacillus TaxID=1055323 RepID=UPI0007B46A0B|nr:MULTISPECIES: GTP pyrophosphokinase family protein [Aeribacillus]KZM55900.1 GTP pyrophosphokinase [Aeribacillus pallidus]MDR9792507.1 GTP pyrophosphokinase family protein [Aeribacillus pallidus]MED0651265.1 GTP pyrophosphokinase family protein [Aeribacillus composti]MED1438543.1 GTP pyrophosphokinase family protein [Aeribacillus composti]MED4486582.1 GTP pyrophosphokinase family protein [Aeribacillus pallidus]
MNYKEWEQFLAPYKQAVEELKVKLKGIRSQFELRGEHSPIEFVTGRVKPVPSILDKAKRKQIPLDKIEEEMQDIAGLRMMCQFVGDIQLVVQMLRDRHDLEIVEERDYITRNKESGYRSYHVVARYPVQSFEGLKKVLVEIQIRTLAMNFWATIEHSLNYKYSGNIPEQIKIRLQRAAEAAYRLDEEMSQIRGEIQEAQAIFSRKTETT